MAALEAENAELRTRMTALERQISRNSGNSSMPSSASWRERRAEPDDDPTEDVTFFPLTGLCYPRPRLTTIQARQIIRASDPGMQ